MTLPAGFCEARTGPIGPQTAKLHVSVDNSRIPKVAGDPIDRQHGARDIAIVEEVGAKFPQGFHKIVQLRRTSRSAWQNPSGSPPNA